MKIIWKIRVDDAIYDTWKSRAHEQLGCYDDDCLESTLWLDRALDCGYHANIKIRNLSKMGYCITFECDDTFENVQAKLSKWTEGHYHTISLQKN
jgi:hypothetical protein